MHSSRQPSRDEHPHSIVGDEREHTAVGGSAAAQVESGERDPASPPVLEFLVDQKRREQVAFASGQVQPVSGHALVLSHRVQCDPILQGVQTLGSAGALRPGVGAADATLA